MAITLVGKKVSFLYTNLKGETKRREGLVVPNAPNLNENFITLQEKSFRGFDLTRVVPGTIRFES